MTKARPRVNPRIQLSSEGIEKLRPAFPIRGEILAYHDGLVTVREDSGVIADYHPDFIEPLQAVPRG